MTTLDPLLPTTERIKTVQTQIRKAIQNHHLLLLKHQVQPSNPEIKNHIDALQACIINMGRSQNELLAQLKKELDCTNFDLKNCNSTIAKCLTWTDIPKHIPIYKQTDQSNENKKIATWRRRRDTSLIRIQPKKHSILKVNSEKNLQNGIVKNKLKMDKEKVLMENNKIKIILNNSEDSLLRPKKMQSVLKSKRNKLTGEFENFQAKVESLDQCETEISRLKENIHNKKSSPSSSGTLSDDNDCAEIIPIKNNNCNLKCQISSLKNNNQKFGPKILTKTRFRCASSGSANCSKRDTRSDSEFVKDKKSRTDLTVSPTKSETSTLSSSSQGVSSEDLPTNWVSMGDLGQDIFLGYLGLVSKAQFDVLKRKRCERKRRSVAGQSSMYNDYFQPPTPKRTYGPRKNSTPIATNQVVVEVAAEVEDEDEKPLKTEQNCSVCHLSGILEVCHSCSDMYHSKCITNSSGGCPTCNAHPSNIKNIVGANSVSSASSMELIKRYLAPSGNTETNSPELTQAIKEES